MSPTLTAPSAPGDYWVTCTLTRDDGSTETLPSQPLTVTAPVLLRYRERFKIDDLNSGDTLYYTEGTDTYVDVTVSALTSDRVAANLATTIEHGDPSFQPISSTAMVRFWIAFTSDAPETKKATITATLASGETREFILYLTPYPVLLPGVYANISRGQDLGIYDVVEWEIGNDKQTGSAVVTLTNLTTGSVVKAETVDAAYLQGRKYTQEITSYGTYEIRVQYADGSEELFNFVATRPSPAPAEPSTHIYPASGFTDSEFTALLWSDAQNETVAKRLEIVGPVSSIIELPLEGGPSSRVLGPFNEPGQYAVQLVTEYTGTEPARAISTVPTFSVSHVPSTVLLDAAWAEPNDVDAWQAVIDSPVTTDRQKLIASEIADLLDAIAGRNGFEVDPRIGAAEAQNSLNTYFAEEKNTEPPQSLFEWMRQQENWQHPEEQAQTKTLIVGAPTSSVAALLAYFNQTTHPWGSLQRLVLGGAVGQSGGDWEYIDYFAQSRGGNVPDEIILAKYRRYQEWVKVVPLIDTFRGWLKQGN